MGRRRLLLGAALALVAAFTLFQSLLALDDALIVLADRRMTATVVEVGAMQRSRSGLYYEVLLQVADPGAPLLEAWADRALKVTGGWSHPPRGPAPGDAVAVYVDATQPRIVPADSIGGRWSWIGTLGFAWALTLGIAWVVRRLWRGEIHHSTGTP